MKLSPMTQHQFEEYLSFSINNYAQEKIKGEGLSPKDADNVAKESYKKLLPNGINSDDNFLYSVIFENQAIGWVWFAKQDERNDHIGFIYDIYLKENFRGKGHGIKLMALIEIEIKSKGLNKIKLHVFGHNTIAQKLYLKSGFQITNIIMSKDI
jgi:ribosomal protein S18 acetylase RimI-like enzyme